MEKFIILPNTCIQIQSGDSTLFGSPYYVLDNYLSQRVGYKLKVVLWNVINRIGFILDSSIQDGYRLKVDETGILITAGTPQNQYYGVCTLIDVMEQTGLELPFMDIEDKPSFMIRGVMLDISRGRIPTMSYLKEVIDVLSLAKVNQIQLYMEHTFAFSFLSEMNMGKDGITPGELMEIDAYCQSRYIELIPCIATFGHLYELLETQSYQHLCEIETGAPYSWMDRQLHHTIDVFNPESIDLIGQMIREIAPCFKSKYLNICADETFDLCNGKNSDKKHAVADIYVEFLNKIMDLVFAEGKIPMYWGDVILRHPALLKSIRSGAIPLHWWYEEEINKEDFIELEKTGLPYYVCPGTSGWNHFMNNYDKAYKNINGMIELANSHKASGILVTDWGDFGHVNQLSTSIPLLCHGAREAWKPSFLRSHIDKTCDYVSLLERIGRERIVTWEYVMKWFYSYYHKNHAYGIFTDVSKEFDLESINESRRKLGVLAGELPKIAFELQGIYAPMRKQDLQEVFCDIQGIEWMLDFFQLLIEKSHDTRIAERIEAWFVTYERLWRLRNKESELYQIRHVVKQICRYIRTVNK